MGNPYGLAIDVQNLLNRTNPIILLYTYGIMKLLVIKLTMEFLRYLSRTLVAPFEGFWIQTLNLDSSDLFLIMKVWLLIVISNSG